MEIGKRIKQRRKELKMSADELGARLGKDRSTIFRYEKGDIENLPLDILEPIAAALLTTPAFLMGWDSKNDDYANRIELSEEERNLILAFRNISDDKKQLVLQMIKAL